MRQIMRNTSTMGLLAGAALVLLSLTGCGQIDPLTRPFSWNPEGVNADNIAAMAANPADLEHGRDTSRRRARVESDGVDRLWSGKPSPLLNGGGSYGGGGGAAAGGGT
jgi:predicted small lipoprotein YifL